MFAFFHGILLAFGLILPLGVQNLFVFNQGTIQSKFSRVLPVVCTASICDTILILVAVQGVSLILLTFNWVKITLLVIGFLFLIYMGWNTWNYKPINNINQPELASVKKQVVFAITVSLINPHAILDTIGVIGTSSINYIGHDKSLFTLACILVSWCWFFSLATIGRLIGKQKKFSAWIVLINKASAFFMWGSAVYMLYSSKIIP